MDENAGPTLSTRPSHRYLTLLRVRRSMESLLLRGTKYQKEQPRTPQGEPQNAMRELVMDRPGA